MSKAPDVIIVGGGIIGCLSAYFLGKHGLTSLVIERDAIASQASGAAAGLLTPLAESSAPGALTDLCMESLRLHRELVGPLTEESGVDYLFADTPILRPAFTEDEENDLRRQYRWQQKSGMSVSWLDGDTLRRMNTWLPPDIRGALYSDVEAQVEAYRLVIAAAQAAEKRGATIRQGEASGLVRLPLAGSRATGVRLADGSQVEGGAVLLAMGPWSCFAGEWLGFPIPVEPLRGQTIKLAPPRPMPEYAIYHGSSYVLPKKAGYLLVGTTEERAGFVRQVTPEGQAQIMRTVLRVAPVLQEARVIESSACLRPLSLDELPILGAVPGWDELYMATGHGRKGILLSVATARYMAQLIATGHSDYDLSPFSVERLVEPRRRS
ncbi:MAG: glycine oxidase ThiO [Chloroflexi bacterium]|nr:glycine oxidase ThiO [Chloroflexota bacterium]